MKKTLKDLIRIVISCAYGLILLSGLAACDEITVYETTAAVDSQYPNVSNDTLTSENSEVSTIQDDTVASETLSPTSSTTTETTLKPEDVTNIETALSPDITTQCEATTPSQDITLAETQQIPETTSQTPETTIAETSQTTNSYTEEQIKQINELLDMAYAYDHDIAKYGIGSIHIKWPQVEQFQPFEAIITPVGGNYNDESNFKFEIDKKTALKFITTIDRDLSKSKLPEGLSPSKIYEMREYALHGVRFTSNKNSNIINKYLSLFTDYIPENCFYFEDKEQISNEQMKALNNYLSSVNPSYKNGVFSVWLTTSSKDNKKTYYIDVLPSTTDETGRNIIDWGFPRCNFQISEHEYNKYSDLLSLSNCYKTVVESQGQTIYNINLMERIPDTLKKQILNLVYRTLVEYKKISDPAFER